MMNLKKFESKNCHKLSKNSKRTQSRLDLEQDKEMDKLKWEEDLIRIKSLKVAKNKKMQTYLNQLM